jgi:hypothetical protein
VLLVVLGLLLLSNRLLMNRYAHARSFINDLLAVVFLFLKERDASNF